MCEEDAISICEGNNHSSGKSPPPDCCGTENIPQASNLADANPSLERLAKPCKMMSEALHWKRRPDAGEESPGEEGTYHEMPEHSGRRGQTSSNQAPSILRRPSVTLLRNQATALVEGLSYPRRLDIGKDRRTGTPLLIDQLQGRQTTICHRRRIRK